MTNPNRQSEGKRTANDDGIYLDDLANGAVVDIETQHHHYRLVKDEDTHAHISGHPHFCPEPVEVEIEGSIGGAPATMPRPGFIGRGMCLLFKHPILDEVRTSRIIDVHRLG